MSLIQVVLGLFVVTGVVLYLSRFRSLLIDRLLVGLVGAGILALVIRPDLSTRAAHVFGVGRGVDLVFYISHAATLLVLILLYAELRAQAARTTELARAVALLTARRPGTSEQEEGGS